MLVSYKLESLIIFVNFLTTIGLLNRFMLYSQRANTKLLALFLILKNMPDLQLIPCIPIAFAPNFFPVLTARLGSLFPSTVSLQILRLVLGSF